MTDRVPASCSTFRIGTREVGPGHPCFIIAEVAQAHDGSLGTAHAFIDLAVAAGADGVKFQTHIAEAESTPSEPWRVKFSLQDETRYEYWKRMEFTPTQWQGLADHCAEAGVIFLSSAFSIEAVELLAGLDMAAWKIASGEVTNIEMVDLMLDTGRPILTSSGMSTLAEIDGVVTRAAEREVGIGVFQCTSAYPCPPENVGLNLINRFVERWGVPVGLSDHSGTIFPSLAAIALGASLIEVHITLSPDAFGPDVAASLTAADLRRLVDGARFIESALESPIDKDEAAQAMAPMRALFTKSLVAANDLPAGTVLARRHLLCRKPGTGLPASAIDSVVGRRLVNDVAAFDVLVEDDFAQ